MIPGGHLTRSKKVFPGKARCGFGAYILCDDGRKRLDMLCALGARSLSNSPNGRISGVLSLSYTDELEAAEAVLKHVAPWASHVRFVKTGSEATHAAMRIARAATGKRFVLIGSWAYHGWHEWCQADRRPNYSPGTIPMEHCTSIVNDRDVAVVFIEPHRWEPVDVTWLRYVRKYCDRVGALLVFDSMIYGGRFALGGASEYFGITPDLECFGKALGNGESIAFIVGNKALAEHGEMVSGTYSGDLCGLSAVMETLKVYANEPVIETLWARGQQLQEGLKRVIPSDLGVCEGAPVHQRVRFFDPAHGEKFSAAMWERDIIWHPGCANVMYAHTPEMIEQVIMAAAESVSAL